METFIQDAAFAFRQLRRSPGFTAVAVATLALGIGANTAIFSVVNGVLLRPLPFHQPEEIVAFVDAGGYKGMLLEFRERSRTLEQIEGFTSFGFEMSLTGDGEPMRVESAAVTAGLFTLLGTTPALGRTFLPEEEWTGEHRVVLLSHGLWQQNFGGDRGLLGQRIRLDGNEHTVVGVMPEGFSFPSASSQLWIPFGIDRSNPRDLWAATAGTLVGRLRPGFGVEAAGAEVRTLSQAMLGLFPWQMPADFWENATVEPLHEWMVGDSRSALLALLGAVGLVLLIGCANVANLLLARVTSRRTEMAIRASLGAGRPRLVRQLLTESLLLAVVAGGVGILVAFWGVELLAAGLPADTPRREEVTLDGTALLVSAALSLLTALLFGAIPALRASALRAFAELKQGGRAGGSRRQSRISGGLVVAEMALAVVLLIGAGLLIRSFSELHQVETGFHPDGLVTATVAPPEFRFTNVPQRQAFQGELLERIRGLAWVEEVALTNRLPFGGGAWGSVFSVEGRPDPATEGGDWPYADVAAVISPDYPATLGVRLVEGRGFTPVDRADSPPVALVNEALARAYWPGESPIGERIRQPGGAWIEIVGVLGDTKMTGLAGGNSGAFYRPMGQADAGVFSVVTRTALNSSAVASGLAEVVRSLDSDTPVEDVRTMPQLIASSLADRRFTMLLLAAFAGVAMVLGSIGIYGLLSWSVNERRKEIGVRMAMGARAKDVQRMVVLRGLLLAGIGCVVGLLAAGAATRLLASLLFEVGTTDARTFLAVPFILMLAAFLAAWLPARKATRVDPMVALASE